jgi:short-subunit dehydrogenase
MKQAVVTGASEGIGRALVKRLIREGYQVLGVARNEARLQELSKECGSHFSFKKLDLSAMEEVEVLGQWMSEHRVHLLVNNAGFGALGDFGKIPWEKQLQMLRLNIEALTRLSYHFVAQAERGDAVLQVASVLGLIPMPAQGVYSATKAYVCSLSESLWYEWRPRGIYCAAICPGSTATEFANRAGYEQSAIPGALLEQPEDVVECMIHALRVRKDPLVVSGWKNKTFTSLSNLIPEKWMLSAMGRVRKP